MSTLQKELETYEEAVVLASRTSVAYERARWNYTLVKEDLSEGIHNYKYAKKLLEDSIDNFDPVNP